MEPGWTRRVTVSRMSERPHEGSSNDPANTQMFRAFVERGDQETGRRWILPLALVVGLALVAVAVLAVTLA